MLERIDTNVTGVTKAVQGDVHVAKAMTGAGVSRLADSRLMNLRRLAGKVEVPLLLLRPPMTNEIEMTVSVADLSFQTEVSIVRSLASAAQNSDHDHGVIPLIDMGDRREGLLPREVVEFSTLVESLDGIELAGLGTHTGSFGGVLPTEESMAGFIETVEECEDTIGRCLPIISGGSTVALPLAEDGDLPDRINDLRLGESILIGTDVTRNRLIPYLENTGFCLEAEIIECRRKPSAITGPTGRNSSGHQPDLRDRGDRLRAIVALGSQDTDPAALEPVQPGMEVLGASSDHLVLDVENVEPSPSVGDVVSFKLRYPALARASASETIPIEIDSQ